MKSIIHYSYQKWFMANLGPSNEIYYFTILPSYELLSYLENNAKLMAKFRYEPIIFRLFEIIEQELNIFRIR